MDRLAVAALLAVLFATTGANAADAPSTRPAANGHGGFLFVTFKGEQSPMTEQIYFALSPDGLQWSVLNKGEPVLVSTVGEKGVRDPHILRRQDGSFVIVATDLSINRNRDWGRAGKAGSKSIVVWESADLVKWSDPRLVKVAPDDAGCTWAPESIYDPEKQDYLVYWSSTTGRDQFAKQRTWAAHTKDFKTFSEPAVLIEKPNTIIDTHLLRDPASGKYYRFIKDEKFKAITMETADQLAGPWSEVDGFSLAKAQGYEGPICFQLKPRAGAELATWCLLLDNYAKGQGYKAWTTTDLASGKFTPAENMQFPFKFRHGHVIALDADEYARVEKAYGSSAGH